MDLEWVDHHRSVGGASLVDFEVGTVHPYLARVKPFPGGYALFLWRNGVWEQHTVSFRGMDEAKAVGGVIARMEVTP